MLVEFLRDSEGGGEQRIYSSIGAKCRTTGVWKAKKMHRD